MQFVLRANSKIVFLFLIMAISTGCSRLQFPWVYKIYVQQGNYIEKDMIDQLEVGMTPEQVRYVMGNPLLADTFHPDRWDYYYSLRRGDELRREKRFSVYFENGALARWEGDYDLSTTEEEVASKLRKKAKAETEGEDGAAQQDEVVPAQ